MERVYNHHTIPKIELALCKNQIKPRTSLISRINYVNCKIGLKSIEGMLLGPVSLTFQSLHQKKIILSNPELCFSFTLEKRTFDFVIFNKADMITLFQALSSFKNLQILGIQNCNRPKILKLKMIKIKFEYIALTRYKLTLA
jgi:hypothetical protein